MHGLHVRFNVIVYLDFPVCVWFVLDSKLLNTFKAFFNKKFILYQKYYQIIVDIRVRLVNLSITQVSQVHLDSESISYL